MKKKCLLLQSNNKDNVFFIKELKKMSKKKRFTLIVSDDFKQIDQTIDFVFCINYQKIITKKHISLAKNGVYVFHSSDLPEGRGWAPIYYSLVNKKDVHILTMLKINDKVDGGEIIAKVYFKKRPGENANSLRKVDNVMTIKIINQTIDDLLSYRLKGQKQTGKGSYRARRLRKDNAVKVNDTLEKIHRHCLAVTSDHPAFYYYQDNKYIIRIRPESLEKLNKKIIKIITFYEKYSA